MDTSLMGNILSHEVTTLPADSVDEKLHDRVGIQYYNPEHKQDAIQPCHSLYHAYLEAQALLEKYGTEVINTHPVVVRRYIHQEKQKTVVVKVITNPVEMETVIQALEMLTCTTPEKVKIMLDQQLGHLFDISPAAGIVYTYVDTEGRVVSGGIFAHETDGPLMERVIAGYENTIQQVKDNAEKQGKYTPGPKIIVPGTD